MGPFGFEGLGVSPAWSAALGGSGVAVQLGLGGVGGAAGVVG